jgi:ferrous iron transport protein B
MERLHEAARSGAAPAAIGVGRGAWRPQLVPPGPPRRGSARLALDSRPTVAIVGNVKVGKSTLFQHLCDGRGEEVRLPGSSVTVTMGAVPGTEHEALDAPGTYSLLGADEDERLTASLLLSLALGPPASGIVFVADGKNLKRSLALALQCCELGVPLLVALNMVDEASARGLTIDQARLAAALGTDVCAVIAREGLGIRELRGRLASLATPRRLVQYPPEIADFLELAEKLLGPAVPARALALMLLVGDPAAHDLIRELGGADMLEQLLQLAAPLTAPDPADVAARLAACFSQAAERLVREVQRSEERRPGRAERLGDLCTRPLTGVPIALAAAALMYLFVGRFAAGFVVDHLKGGLLDGRVLPWLAAHLGPLLPGAFVRDAVLDPQLGLVQTGLFLPVGLVVPPLFCFYLLFGALEDSGYLPRLSALLNRALHVVGLNGKGVLPLALGFSCVTMAMLATRTLDSRRERIIASFLLLLGVPCAPLLAVMLIVLGPLPAAAAATVFALLLGQVVTAGVLLSRFLPGRPTPLLLELVPLRLPRPGAVLRRAVQRSACFVREALPLFLVAGLGMFVFARLGGLQILERGCRPLVNGVLGLPAESVQVFLKALVRRETGAAELVTLRHAFNGLQLVVIVFLMTFAVPCINTVLVLLRERGARVAVPIIGGVMAYALIVGALLSRLARGLGVTFS